MEKKENKSSQINTHKNKQDNLSNKTSSISSASQKITLKDYITSYNYRRQMQYQVKANSKPKNRSGSSNHIINNGQYQKSMIFDQKGQRKTVSMIRYETAVENKIHQIILYARSVIQEDINFIKIQKMLQELKIICLDQVKNQKSNQSIILSILNMNQNANNNNSYNSKKDLDNTIENQYFSGVKGCSKQSIPLAQQTQKKDSSMRYRNNRQRKPRREISINNKLENMNSKEIQNKKGRPGGFLDFMINMKNQQQETKKVNDNQEQSQDQNQYENQNQNRNPNQSLKLIKITPQDSEAQPYNKQKKQQKAKYQSQKKIEQNIKSNYNSQKVTQIGNRKLQKELNQQQILSFAQNYHQPISIKTQNIKDQTAADRKIRVQEIKQRLQKKRSARQ